MKTLLLAAVAAVALAAPAQAVQLRYSFDGTLTFADSANNTMSSAFSLVGTGDTDAGSVVNLFGTSITLIPFSNIAASDIFTIPAGGTLNFGATGNMVGLLVQPGDLALGFTGVSNYYGQTALAPTAITLAFTNPAPVTVGGYTLTGGSGTFSAAAVPEPATWVLMALGFGLVGNAARRRRRIAAA